MMRHHPQGPSVVPFEGDLKRCAKPSAVVVPAGLPAWWAPRLRWPLLSKSKGNRPSQARPARRPTPVSVLSKIMRAGEGKILRKLHRIADQVSSIEEAFVDLSDA